MSSLAGKNLPSGPQPPSMRPGNASTGAPPQLQQPPQQASTSTMHANPNPYPPGSQAGPPPVHSNINNSTPNLNTNAEAGPGPRTVGQGQGPPQFLSSSGLSGLPGTATTNAAQKREEERRKEVAERKRREREEMLMKKDKSLGEMLVMLEDYQPLVSVVGDHFSLTSAMWREIWNLDTQMGSDAWRGRSRMR